MVIILAIFERWRRSGWLSTYIEEIEEGEDVDEEEAIVVLVAAIVVLWLAASSFDTMKKL